ncbi:hypothetical protein IKF57_00900 [Candidatus Saccharibacteria bacterium]|nr:hypothetical protein [Candidatus Saccharibacteria bacterium]
MDKDNKKKSRMGSFIIIGAIGLIAVILIIILSQGKETYTSNGGQTVQVNSLTCSGSNIDGALFVSDTAQRYTHEIKATVSSNKLREISYKFNATYNSREAVEDAKAVLMAKYNIYMDENGLVPEILNPVFSPLNSKLQVTLFAKREKIDRVTARIFFLTEDDIEKIDKMNLADWERSYEKKGFSCQSNE